MSITADKEISFNKFVTTNGDIDECISERVFSGRITKDRYKKIDSFCRKYTGSWNCGHEYDCCGCMCGRRLEFTYRANQVVITMIEHFNY